MAFRKKISSELEAKKSELLDFQNEQQINNDAIQPKIRELTEEKQELNGRIDVLSREKQNLSQQLDNERNSNTRTLRDKYANYNCTSFFINIKVFTKIRESEIQELKDEWEQKDNQNTQQLKKFEQEIDEIKRASTKLEKEK